MKKFECNQERWHSRFPAGFLVNTDPLAQLKTLPPFGFIQET